MLTVRSERAEDIPDDRNSLQTSDSDVDIASGGAQDRTATLLLLPGIDGTGIMFAPFLAAARSAWQTKTLSYPQRAGFSYRHLVGLVRESLPENDFFILGESFSGPIALKIAAERPKGLRGVILCATFVRNPTPLLPARLGFLAVAPLFSLWPVSLKLGLLATFRASGEIRSLVKRVRRLTNNRALAARTRAAIGVDVEREFSACPYPLLYLCGRRDIVVPGRNIASMQRLRPDMDVRRLETSHLVLQEAPAEAAAHIDAFMRKVLSEIAASTRPRRPGR